MRKLLTFFSVSRAFDPFFGRRLPVLMAALGLADSRSEAIACHRQGGSGEAVFLRRSLEQMRTPIVGCGVAAEEEFEAVLAATADTSFSFVDALSVAAWAQSRLTMLCTETRWISMTAGSGVPGRRQTICTLRAPPRCMPRRIRLARPGNPA